MDIHFASFFIFIFGHKKATLQPSYIYPFALLFSHSVVSDSLWPHGLQHTRLPCPSPSPRAYSNSCPLSQWCHPTISSSITHFSSFPQSSPASGSFPMSCLFTSGSQSIEASALASVLPMNIQGWFLLGLTSLISFKIDCFDILAVQGTLKSFPAPQFKHRFFSAQPSLWSSTHMHTWMLEKS